MMKVALRISIGLNAVLFGGLVIFLVNHRMATAGTAARASSSGGAPAHVAATPPARFQTALKAFRWRELESTNDYRVFVENLRAAGCPEPTVEDIVRGDVERTFSFERRQLSLNGAGSGPWSRRREVQLEAGLLGEQPRVAETAVPASAESQARQQAGNQVAEISPSASGQSLGGQNGSGQTAGDTAQTQNVRRQPYQSDYTPSYPLAYENTELDALNLSASQKAAIRQVRQQFVNEIGGPDQNPDNPAYLETWQKAQSEADDLLRATLGVQDYMALQLRCYYANFQQLMEKSGGNPGTINPDALSK